MKLSINTTITLSLSNSLMGGSINFAQNMMFRALFENNTWITIFFSIYTTHSTSPRLCYKTMLLPKQLSSSRPTIVFLLTLSWANPNFLLSKWIKFSTMCYISFGQTCKKLSCTSSSITIYSKNAVQYLHAKGKQNPQNLTCLIQIVD